MLNGGSWFEDQRQSFLLGVQKNVRENFSRISFRFALDVFFECFSRKNF